MDLNFFSWMFGRVPAMDRGPKNETVEEHKKHCRAKFHCPFDDGKKDDRPRLNVKRDPKKLAQEKVDEWMDGVTEASVRNAIADYVIEGKKNGNIKVKADGEAFMIALAANFFFREYSQKVIKLSDGRCVYFTPDIKNRERGLDNSMSWAVYSVHAVTHGGRFLKEKGYNERVWTPEKAENILRIEPIVKGEKCVAELDYKLPSRDAVVFVGEDAKGERMNVVTRLDEYGNINANLSEVTTVLVGGKVPSTECYSPLTKAVKEVVIHQADGYSHLTKK